MPDPALASGVCLFTSAKSFALAVAVLPHRLVVSVSLDASLNPFNNAAFSHTARCLDRVRRARDAFRLELGENHLEGGRAQVRSGGVVLLQQPNQHVGIFKSQVRSLPKVLWEVCK